MLMIQMRKWATMIDATNNILTMFSYGTNIASCRKILLEVLSGVWGASTPSQAEVCSHDDRACSQQPRPLGLSRGGRGAAA